MALVAHDIHDSGGMERAFAELLRHAAGEYEFTVYSSTLAPDLRELVKWERIAVPRRPFALKFAAFFALAGVRLGEGRHDLVHTLGAIVPNRADLATIQFCHRGYVAKLRRLAPAATRPLRRLNRGAARLLALSAERWCYRRSRLRLFAAVSPGVERELATYYPAIRTSITPNGLDVARYLPDETAREDVRAQEGMGADDVALLFVGGDWDRKGLALAIDALAIAGARERLTLWVVGPGDRRRYGRLAARLGVDTRVRFFGPRQDAERFYQAADIFVFPTQYETFSLVAYEAAASGLPIVATRVSGIEDLVDGSTGLLVDRNAASVAAAIDSLATDPQARERMGRAARSRASEYTWERSSRSVTRLYRELLDRSGGAAL